MANAKKKLVIVESPAKAKTIEKYLGNEYRVVASMGHLRDLPKSRFGVDIENGFIPEYVPVTARKDVIEELKKQSRSAETIFLATDPDREGEAISWHLKELLQIPDDKTKRVTFNEITKKVVQDSIAHPRGIDIDLVNAQQARRVLDRIVGYKVSPLLWKKIQRGLSAGRVQSAAAKMVVDREREIEAFQAEEFWNLDATLERQDGQGVFTARYYGDNGKKRELRSEAETDAVISDVRGAPWSIGDVQKGEKQRSPAPPFITSTLQQEASRRLGMTPRKTMSVAQELYEGVEISGEGSVGLITYMRTDSLRLSEDALASAGTFIRENYGAEYYPGKPRRFKTKAGAQDAHEAIRPSNVRLTPDRVRQDLKPDQYRLYRLIWCRFVASQMANASYDTVTIDAVAAGHTFRTSRSSIRFPGYTKVYAEPAEEGEEQAKKPLPDLAAGELVTLTDIRKEQKFTDPPSRYTEATLVRAMEEKGIGRPSTYAPTITTITGRTYVSKDGKYIKPTPLGDTVNRLMENCFPDIVDAKFTARMETNLDRIEEGKADWKEVLSEFYAGFSRELGEAEKSLSGERIRVPDEETDEICEVCGRRMVVKNGRFGRFLACPGYPECSFTKPIVVEMPGKCPKCGGRILKRTSKKGYTYYACENGKDCGFMTWDVPVADVCPSCGKTMFKLSGKGSRKPFCANSACPDFLPEDKRGYRRKAASSGKEKKAAKPKGSK